MMYSEASAKQPELDHVLPTASSLPSFTLPNEISSKTLGTDSSNQETVLLNSFESSLSTTLTKPDDEEACEQKEEEAAQGHE